MKVIYPIIITNNNNKYLVYIPDFDISAQVNTLDDVISVSEDLIQVMYTDLKEDGKVIPKPTDIFDIDISATPFISDGSTVVSLVEVDFCENSLEIFSTLTISSNHIKSSTANDLDYFCKYINSDYSDYDYSLLNIIGYDYGYFIYIPEDLEELYLPEDLSHCLNFAKSVGCGLICIDYDAEPINELQIYD